MLKVTAEEVNYVIYQYLNESGMSLPLTLLGFQHAAFVFHQEANMHENKYNNYRIPSGLLIVFLEKALTLIHMETHLSDVLLILTIQNEEIKTCNLPFTLLNPHHCDSSISTRERISTELESMLELDNSTMPSSMSKKHG